MCSELSVCLKNIFIHSCVILGKYFLIYLPFGFFQKHNCNVYIYKFHKLHVHLNHKKIYG